MMTKLTGPDCFDIFSKKPFHPLVYFYKQKLVLIVNESRRVKKKTIFCILKKLFYFPRVEW